ncbi:hypothetical protein TWF192_008229 [Orbilia oligospora]|uniref:Uncharacterized protein n=1 Tax=Orbilia oligospora TaxID=2813651 RepID=A0A6G1MKB8_ORBOL|nr:hypothetical protein TWF679_001279 [Orbilia oligospora]KAF3261771.1 hypothetical protein TWF192_008229 [Orbilia oligospora]
MSVVPKPPSPLGRHCTTIVDNTLYAYTENGFFSIPLKSGGKWKEIKGKQVPTKGSVCVHSGVGTADEALYIVGGDVAPQTETENPEYKGLQKYSFAQKKWENQQLQDKTLFNLTHHGAAFLEESKQIFVYAGNWYSEDYQPSSMAFLINVSDMMVSSLPTGLAPPLIFPVVQALNAHTAIISGGDPANTHVFSYSSIEGWKNLPNTLAAPLPVGSAAGAVVGGDDGSKMLLTFDFSQSPANVELVPLYNATALPAAPAKLRTRDHTLTSANWPSYNATLAPKGTRRDFAITSNNQYVVISGGGSDNDPLSIFDYKEGGWVSAASLFGTQKVLDENVTLSAKSRETSTAVSSSQVVSSTATLTSAATIAATVTSTAGLSSATESSAVEGEPQGLKTSTQLLFIILGVVLLVALILGTAYIILRCKRKKMKAAGLAEKPGDEEGPQSRGMGGMPAPGRRDSGMSFKDRGASFMKEAGGTKTTVFGRRQKSFRERSMKEELEFPHVDLPRGAVLGPAAGTNLEMQPTQRGSGWSRYFSGNSTTNLVQNGAGLQRNPSDASRSSYSMSEFPDDHDERRQSYPSIGYVRSSYASHSAVFSSDLPTPTFGDVMRDSSPPQGDSGYLGFEPPRAPGLFERSAGSQISVSSAGASSINFFGEALSHPDFAKKVAHAQSKHNLNIGQPEQARVESSVYSEADGDNGILQPPNSNFNRTDSFGFFGNDRPNNTNAAPRGDQGLGWFVRD